MGPWFKPELSKASRLYTTQFSLEDVSAEHAKALLQAVMTVLLMIMLLMLMVRLMMKATRANCHEHASLSTLIPAAGTVLQ